MKNNTEIILKYITPIATRLLLIAIFFLLGYWWRRGSIFALIALIFVSILSLIFILISYYLGSLVRKKVILLKGRHRAINESLKVRIEQWNDVIRTIEKVGESGVNDWKEIEKKDLLNVMKGISRVVRILGHQFYNEIVIEKHLQKNIQVRVSYLRKEEGKEYITITSEDSIYLSKNELRIQKIGREHFRFTKDDGSAAGAAWASNNPVFIADVSKELKKPETERRFKILNQNEEIQAIICIPIVYEDLFFGVLCINCSHPNTIEQNPEYIAEFFSDYEPIINHLILIELIRVVRDKFWEKFKQLKL